MNPSPSPSSYDMRARRTNVWLVLFILSLSLVAGYVVTLCLARFHPRFTAVGLVRVDPPIVNDPIHPGNTSEDLGALALEQRTTATLLKNNTLIYEVLSSPEVRDTLWFQQFASAPDGIQGAAAAADLRDNLVVTSNADSSLITVSMSCNDPKSATTIVEELVDRHMLDQEEESNAERSQRSQVLISARDGYVQSIARDSIAVRENAARLNINADGSSAAIVDAQTELANLAKTRTDLTISLNNVQVQKEDLEKQIMDGIDPIQVIEAANRDDGVVWDQRTLKELQLDELSAAASAEQTDASKSLEPRIKGVQKMLDDDLVRAKSDARRDLTETFNNQAAQLQRSIAALDKQIEEQRFQLRDFSGVLADYKLGKDEVAGLTELKKEADSQIDQIKHIAEIKNASGIRWAQHPAAVAETDSADSVMTAVTMSFAFLVGLGLCLAFARRPYPRN